MGKRAIWADDMATQQNTEERRRSPRLALKLHAFLRESGKGRVPIRMVDISAYGCRIELPGVHSLPSNVWLYLSTLDALYVRVAWCLDAFAGLEFEHPLHDAVLDNLLNAQSDTEEPSMAELYDIARRSHQSAARARPTQAANELKGLARDCATVVLNQLLNHKIAHRDNL
ncbi:MAG: PilZ domain-containing protein [Sphingomonadaceae bacterium]